jgi:hypothetical protein
MHFLLRQYHKSINIFKSTVIADENKKKWLSLKDKYKGERVFLIGNGPSLNKTPLYLLKNEYTLCFNRFHLLHERLNWFPHFYMCIDPEVLPNIANEINDNLCNYNYSFFHALHSSDISKNENVLLMHHVVQVPYFSKNLPLFGSGGTVAYAGLQMLLYLGFSEIYLVGVDQNYVIHKSAVKTKGIRIESQKDDDPNHFDPRYFGKGKKYHQPVVATRKRMIRAFEKAKEVAKSKGVNIKNAGIGGELEVYERVQFEKLFDYTETDKYKLFSETISGDINFESIKNFLNISKVEDVVNDDVLNKGYFVINSDLAQKELPRLIFDFIPYGPINNKFIFLRRSDKDQMLNGILRNK